MLAETCVFGKQLHGFFRCGPHCSGQTLSRSYGRYIAEFLKKGSLVRLGLLDLSTCVGLRYGRQCLSRQQAFLVSLGYQNYIQKGRFHSRFNRNLDA